MTENNLEIINKSEMGWLNNKLLFSLSFILVIYTLKGYLLGLFKQENLFSLFGINFLPEQLLNFMFLIFLISLYLYAFNYFFKDPLKFQFMSYLNKVASFIWALFLLFPFFIALIFVLNLFISHKEVLLSILGVILGGLLSFWMVKLSLKQTRDLNLQLLDLIIERIKSSPVEKDKVSQFLRFYSILETQIKKSLLIIINLDVVNYKSINLQEAIRILHAKKFLDDNLNNLALNAWSLRNAIIHMNKEPSGKDIEMLKDIINKIELKLRDVDIK